MCQGCGRPFASGATEFSTQQLCRLCRVSFYAFDCARSFAIYDEALSKAVVLLKYEEVIPLGDWFASRLAEIVPLEGEASNEWRADLVVPVPLHAERRRERGYNQAELIARPLAARLQIRLAPRLLIRTRPRPPRLVLSRTEHWKSVRGAYAIAGKEKIDDLRILLIDDVLTTGATLDACSRILKKAGAAAVVCLTVGRVKSALDATGSPRKALLRTPSEPEKESRTSEV
jgi:competence protein ComFC